MYSMNIKITPILLAGGEGKRLWPLSRKNYPKQFIDVKDGINLFQNTLQRINDYSLFNPPLIVCGKNHQCPIEDSLRKFKITRYTIILEPDSKNTAVAVTVASLLLKNKEQPMLVLPIDHHIKNQDDFIKDISFLSKKIDKLIIILGAKFSKANHGFGYVQKGSKIENSPFIKAINFIEKPDVLSMQSLDPKDYLLNMGILLAFPKTVISEIGKYAMDLLKYAESALEKATVKQNIVELGGECYKFCPNISIDKALLEKTKMMAIYPCEFDWLDIGSFGSYAALAPKDMQNNGLIGKGLFLDSENCYINSENAMTVAMGLKDINIIVTRDSILVINKDKVEKIGDVIRFLQKNNLQELIDGNKEYRPWGYYENLIVSDGYKIKKIVVNPKGILSLQSHEFRAEQWTVIKGIATVTVNEKVFNLTKNQSTYIPIKAKHRLENQHNEILEILEIQLGEKLTEDDIHRYDDIYGRV
jgi:mannose-1-phosphate guanylyltransferase/mannose-6-phosphate isomerase